MVGMSRWEMLSEAWGLGNLGRVAGEGLTALTMLRLAEAGKVKVALEHCKESLLRVDRLLLSLIDEVKSLRDVSDRYKIPLDSLASPILRAFLGIYGVANSKEALERLDRLRAALRTIVEEGVKREEVEVLEEFLETVLNVSAEEVERLTRSSEMLWKK